MRYKKIQSFILTLLAAAACIWCFSSGRQLLPVHKMRALILILKYPVAWMDTVNIIQIFP